MDDKYYAVMAIIECELQDIERRERNAKQRSHNNTELLRELQIIRHTIEMLRHAAKRV